MFSNYFAATLRNLVRNKLYAAINIVGLAVGFAAALLLGLFARDELTYDRWISGHERIYRVSGYAVQDNIKRSFDVALFSAADALKQDFPEIEALTRVSIPSRSQSLRHGEREYPETLYWADANLFDVLPLPIIAGDPHTALADPDGIVLTQAMARKYFGRDAPIGAQMEIGRKFPVHVTAVIADLPSDTHLDLGIIVSARSESAREIVRAFDNPDALGYVYMRLAPDISVDRLRAALPAFSDRHPETRQRRYPFWIDQIVPIADIHLRPTHDLAMKPAGSAATAYSALAIAVLIMAVAAFNFINLSTARATRRAVEVGVRKTSGAMRRQLIVQFIGEAVIYAVLGMTIALTLAMSLLPTFDAFLQRTIALNFGRDPVLAVMILAVVALVGIAAGAYPAFVLSHFAPATVLKGTKAGRRARGRGRQVLVTVQFAVLIVLALMAAAIHRQVHYATTEALRFDKDQMLLVYQGCLPPLLAEVRALPGVRNAACSADGFINYNNQLQVTGSDGQGVRSQMLEVDFDTFDLFELKPVAGRLFSAAIASDAIQDGEKFVGPRGVVINQRLSRALGFATPEEAVGKTFRVTFPFQANSEHAEVAPEIVGVVQDFAILNPEDLRASATPRFFFVWPRDLHRGGTLTVKLAGSRIPETLAAIDVLWTKLGPPRPMDRVFLDQRIDEVYRAFTRLSQTIGIFAGVAIFISSLGLVGLAAFAAEQRTKEIGVRKALGASSGDILRLMLWEFSRPVMWASLVSWPIAYLIMRHWLDGFADHIDIGFWMFPLATGLALTIAAVTVTGHAIFVARAEPVSALRYE